MKKFEENITENTSVLLSIRDLLNKLLPKEKNEHMKVNDVKSEDATTKIRISTNNALS